MRNSTRISFLCSFLFSTILLNSQTLELVDRIHGGLGPIVDLAVNSSGQRFYLFNKAYDSIIVNDRFLQIPPKDPEIGSPYYWGRNYLIIADDDSVILRRPGGTALLLNDTSLFVATTIVEDTLITQDTIFINEASGDDGQNLLLIQYDFHGNVSKTKHWRTANRSYLSIDKLTSYKNKLFFCGEYTSLDEVILDSGILEPGSANGYFANMDNEFNVHKISVIKGILHEYFIRMSKSLNDKFLLIGSSTSYKVEVCNDTLYNQADNTWGTTFLFSVLFDSTGSCINSKSIDYDFGGIISTSIFEMPGTAFLVAGLYNSSYITLDEITLHNPNYEQRGFLYKINSEGDLIDAFQLEGSEGSKRIESVIYDEEENIWITGMCQSDTLQIGKYFLYADESNEPFGYLARLSRDLDPELVLKLNFDSYNLILGQDENVYLIESLYQPNDTYRLYKIISNPNSLNPDEDIDNFEITIYPNPAINTRHVNYTFSNPGERLIERINVYDIRGILFESRLANSTHGTINLLPCQNVLFVEFLLNNGSRLTKKLFAN